MSDAFICHTCDGMDLYKVVAFTDVAKVEEEGLLKPQTGQWHVGLRERCQDAVDREARFEDVSKHTHAVLRIHFTSLGLAHFTTTAADHNFGFAPLLHKKSYSGWQKDWKVFRICVHSIKISRQGMSSETCGPRCKDLMSPGLHKANVMQTKSSVHHVLHAITKLHCSNWCLYTG